jgi:Winged helix DNA-binding domain
VGDMQTWSYLTNLQPVFEEMRDELVCYALGRGREAFDLPGLTIESADTPAPVRFLPEFDNLLLAHTDRTRVVPKAYRKSVFLPGLRVAATVLIDGYVGGVWATERTRKQAVLTVTPFLTPSAAVRTALEEEGEQLLRFAEPEATAFDVRIDVP